MALFKVWFSSLIATMYIFWVSTFSCLDLPLFLSGCLDMVAIEGQFTFTAERPQLNCAVFFIGEPSDIISIEYNSVNIDCRGGDFIKVKSSYIFCVYKK